MKFSKNRMTSAALALGFLSITAFGIANVFNGNGFLSYFTPNNVYVQKIKAQNIEEFFSTANLFFVCVWGVTAFSYFYACFEKMHFQKLCF